MVSLGREVDLHTVPPQHGGQFPGVIADAIDGVATVGVQEHYAFDH
jgi:hypothetical protein